MSSSANQLAWWQRPVRMMRLDYGPELQRMREADLADLAHSIRHDWHVNCEWIIGTPGVAPGTAQYVTFNSTKFAKYPALGDWDLIRNYLPHARREGIHVLAYVNMHWYAPDFAAEHPGWEQLQADGRPYGQAHPLYGYGTTFCVNSPWRNWAFDLIAEIAATGIDGVFLDGPVIFPGCCYCASCRAMFREKYGHDLPPAEDWSSPVWKSFIDFREESMAWFLRDARAALHAVNPQAVIFLNAGSWHGGSWRVARNIEKVGEFQEFNGAELFFHPGPNAGAPIPWAITAKHLVAPGNPAVVFSHHALGGWHYIPLPPLEAKIAAAETVACGANPWIAVFDYSLDHSRAETMQPIREIFGFLDAHEEYYTATESAADVAVLYSRQSATYYVSDLDDLFLDRGSGREQHLVADLGTGKKIVDWNRRKQISDSICGSEFAGWCLALSRNHVFYDVILDSQVTDESLRRYQTVVLPNAACLSDAQVDVLNRYVSTGGRIVASFETGRYQERGEHRESGALDNLLGIAEMHGAFSPAQMEEYAKVMASDSNCASSSPGVSSDSPVCSNGGAVFPEGRLLPRSTYVMQVVAAAGRATPVQFLQPTQRLYAALRDVSPYAAEIRGCVGKGRVVYLPHALGEAYYRFRIAEQEQWMASALRWAYGDTAAITVDAPPTVQAEWRRQGHRHLVHLVNHTGDTQRPIAFVLPVNDISITVRGLNAGKAYMLRSNTQLQAELVGDKVWRYHLPPLAEYDVAVFEEE